MRVKVTAPSFCDHSVLDDYGWIEMPSKSVLRDLLKRLKVPLLLRPLLLIQVNYENAAGSVTLHEEDVVTIFWPISGG